MKPLPKLILLASLGAATLAAQVALLPDPTPVSAAVNSELPSWLRFSGEERARTEYIQGEGFKPVGDLYLLNRLRLNMDVRAAGWLRFSFQAEDARVFGQNTLPAPATQKDAMDLRVGYVEIGGPESVATLRAGRQSLDFGDGRLVADPNWSNVGRTFDAARLTLRHRRLKLDLFTGAVVKIDPVGFDLPAPGGHFHGAYGSLGGLVPGAVIEPYVFWRLDHNYRSETGRPGNLDEKTVGYRWAGKLPEAFDYTAEMAAQAGSWAGDRIAAWMGRWIVGHTFVVPGQPRLFLEYARASGDPNPTDRRHATFDPLFPVPHDVYGLTDLFFSQNIVQLRPAVQFSLRPNLRLTAAYDDFRLASARDGLYVAGRIAARSLDGAAGAHIGQEADLQARWTVGPATEFTIGCGHLFPGRFLRSTTAGVPYNLVFLNLAQRF